MLLEQNDQPKSPNSIYNVSDWKDKNNVTAIFQRTILCTHKAYLEASLPPNNNLERGENIFSKIHPRNLLFILFIQRASFSNEKLGDGTTLRMATSRDDVKARISRIKMFVGSDLYTLTDNRFHLKYDADSVDGVMPDEKTNTSNQFGVPPNSEVFDPVNALLWAIESNLSSQRTKISTSINKDRH